MAGKRSKVFDVIPQNAVGAEIGVFRGNFSNQLLKLTNPQKLYLIDPWVNSDDPGLSKSWYGKGRHDMGEIYKAVIERFAPQTASAQVEILRHKAADAAAIIPDSSLDFIYIDGDHRYQSVAVDLEIAYRKTKPDALIILDDYGLEGWWGDGVVRASSEFLGQNSTMIHIQELVGGQLILKRHEEVFV
jgi:hypothetical protein